jgi:malto-oligosyltrehalose trehalohydrolase
MKRHHALPFGAELTREGVRFRLWAPRADAVALRLEGLADLAMAPEGGGWFGLTTAEAGPGSRYRYVVAGRAMPDPASRYQPEDVHGPSEVIDPGAYDWRDGAWPGLRWEEIVLYELHTGTFSAGGDFAGVERHLDHLERLGVTAVELMPIADFPGARNWGYDGVLLFAPDSCYGRPEHLKRLVEACHDRGLAVFLDVVYNHLGPEGNYLPLVAPDFFTARHHTPWGAAIAFDGEEARAVRGFYVENALYWLEEFHLDGLRFDAVHAIRDDSARHILVEIAETVRCRLGGERPIHLVLENDRNEARLLGPELFTAQWDDDLHHALRVLTSGEIAGYYADYANAPAARLGRALAEGFAYQGEVSDFRGERRGEPSAHLPATAFVSFIQNHDHVGNNAFGTRLARLASPDALRVAAAIYLLSPPIPLLFMGEEWGAVQPFPFFCDFGQGLAEKVRDGRRREFARLPEFRDEAARAHSRPLRRRDLRERGARLERTRPRAASRLALLVSGDARAARARDRAAAARHGRPCRTLAGARAARARGLLAPRRRHAAPSPRQFRRPGGGADRAPARPPPACRGASAGRDAGAALRRLLPQRSVLGQAPGADFIRVKSEERSGRSLCRTDTAAPP